ncbi:MAG: oligosaccharide flippase family protein [Nitrospirae bacterium]|nr:oligosaccharide flippase family protein [Nitrospirota bacterium]
MIHSKLNVTPVPQIKKGINSIMENRWSSKQVNDVIIANLTTRYIHLVELFLAGRVSADNIDVRVSSICGLEHLDSAIKLNKGVILLSFHLGSYGIPLAALGYKGYSLFQHIVDWQDTPLITPDILKYKDNTFYQQNAPSDFYPGRYIGTIEKSILGIKKRCHSFLPVKMLYHKEKHYARNLLRCLGENSILSIMGDGSKGSRFTNVDFLGKKISFSTGPASLAAITGAAILPVFTIRENDRRHKVIIHSPIFVKRKDSDSIEDAVAAYTALLENYVMEYPGHWYTWDRLTVTRDSAGEEVIQPVVKKSFSDETILSQNPPMKQSQRIAKNIVTGVLGEALGAVLHLLTIVSIARYLGTSGFGEYAFVMAFVGIFEIAADLGLRNIFIREIAVDKENVSRHLGIMKLMIWAFSILSFLLIVIIINIVSSSHEIIISSYIAGLAALSTFHAVGYGAVCRAFEDMEYNAVGFTLHKTVLFGLISLAIWFHTNMSQMFFAYLGANIFLWIYYYLVVRFKYVKPRMIWDPRGAWYMFREAVPLGIAEIIRKVTWQVDTIILSMISTSTAVGLFNAAYKVIQAINLIPITLAHPLFPMFARLGKESPRKLFEAHDKAIKMLFSIGLPMAVILTVYADLTIALLFGPKFHDAVPALQLMSWALFFLFPTSLYVYLFTSIGKQKLFTVASFSCLGINILIDFLLIPYMSFIGACFGTLLSEATLCGVGVYFIHKMGHKVSWSGIAGKPFIAGLLLVVLLYFTRHLPLIWQVSGFVSGMGVYVYALFIMNVFSKNEIDMIIEGASFGLKKVRTSSIIK